MSKAFVAGLLSLTLYAVLAAETRLDGIAAVVGDEVILQSEVESYSLLRISNLGLNKDSVDLDSYRKKFLDELVDGKVLLVHAKNDSTISVTDQEVENAVNNHISMLLKQNNLTLTVPMLSCAENTHWQSLNQRPEKLSREQPSNRKSSGLPLFHKGKQKRRGTVLQSIQGQSSFCWRECSSSNLHE